MFQFPQFPLRLKVGVLRLFTAAGYPIRRSPAKLARQQTGAYRSRATSFIGLQRLGIHRAPLVASSTIPLPPQRVLGSLRSSTLYSLVNVLTGFAAGPSPPTLGLRLGLAGRVRRKTAGACALSWKGRPSGRPRE